MITKTYKCDRCGAEQKTDTQFWIVNVAISSGGRPYSHRKGMEVCRKCLEDMGLIPPADKERPLPPPPTLEDMIREIVQQEINNE